jgi:phenylacetate-CoA ligase
MAIDFRIRDFFHPILIGRLWHEFESNPTRSADEMRALQERRLRAVVRHSWENVPHYRRKMDETGLVPEDIRTLEDLPRLPVLSKEQARAAGATLHAKRQAGLHPVAYHTSGTSGTPFELLHDKFSNALEFVYYWRHWGWAGYRLGNAFAQLSSVYFLNRGATDSLHAWQPHLRRLVLSSILTSKSNAGEMARELERRGCLFLKGVASSVYHLALSMREAGVTPRPLRAVICASEVLLPHQSTLIQEVFQCVVLDSYGHMERTVAVSQCERGGRHVNSDYGVLEFINKRPSPDGSSVLAEGLGTGLHSRVMPFLRYETGDTFELFREARTCSCGRHFPLIKAIHGRQEECVETPDGRFLTCLFLLPEFVSGISEAQFVQEAEDRLVVCVVPAEGFDAAQEEKLKHYTQTVAGPSMQVRVQRCGRQDLVRSGSGKRRVVIPFHCHGTSDQR